MADIRLSVGTAFYISTTLPATYDEAGFDAISNWIEVGEVETIGEFGGEATITPFIPLKTGVVKKRKGSIDYGTATVSIGRLVGDTGQAALKAAFDGANAYDVHAFKVVDDDNEAFFTGLVGSFTTVRDDADSVTRINCNIELDNKVIDVAV